MTYMHRFHITFFALLSVCSTCLAAQSDSNEVTLSRPVVPLSELVAALSTPGTPLAVSTELRECKATVALQRADRQEVMSAVADVFGAEWTPRKDEPGVMELRRQKDVSDWLKSWRAARRQGEAAARAFQENSVLGVWEKAFASLDKAPQMDEQGAEILPDDVHNRSMTRLVQSLGNGVHRQLVRHLSMICSIRAGGEFEPAPAPLMIPFRNLSGPQQKLVRESVSGSSNVSMQGSTLLFGFPDGIALTVEIASPGSADSVHVLAFGSAWGSPKLEARLQDVLLAEMSKKTTPAGALLGAKLVDGKVVPTLQIESKELSTRALANLPENGLSWEIIMAIAKPAELQLVADYHTLSRRLLIPDRRGIVNEVLFEVANKMQRAVRQKGSFLLVRNQMWPDRDDEEVPWPHPESWIARKTDGAGLTLDDLSVMGQLPIEKLDGIAGYRDPRIDLRPEVSTVRRNRWVFRLAGVLTDDQRKKAFGKTGLPIRTLSLNQRNFVQQSVASPVPITQVRLFLSTEVRPDKKSDAFMMARLIAEGSDFAFWIVAVPQFLTTE